MGLGGDAVDDVTRDPRDDPMPYGVDTIRLRISFPAAPVSQGYNGRAWNMRPLRGWTGGGQAAGVEPSAGTEQGSGYAGESVALPMAGRMPATSNGNGGTVPSAGGDVTNVALEFDPKT